MPTLIVRLVAFGEEGAFGEPDAINVFAPAETCDPEPLTNLAFIDVSQSQSNHLQILNNGDQQVIYQDAVGPAADPRRAARATGTYMNFGITDNYLGKPCNDPRAMKICVEFFDDPALAGARFGPEAYATDAQGSVAMLSSDQWHTLIGSGQWIRRSWTVPAVNLFGVNAMR